MQLYCQSCQAAYAAASHCPRCGSRLLSPQESHLSSGKRRKPPPEPIATSFGNRLFVGCLFAIGLCFGIREIAFAVGIHPAFTEIDQWNEANTQPTTFALRLIAVLGGGLLAGAGRRQGLQVGATVGLTVGGLFTAFDVISDGHMNNLTALLLAMSYPLVAGLAGIAGSSLWPADAVLPEPTHQSSRGSSLARLAIDDAERRTQRPIAWIQIVLASVLVVMATTMTDPIRMGLAKYSAGWFNTAGVQKSAWVGLEIATLVTLIAGMIAGAGTGSGLKHGLLAGILAAVGLMIGADRQPNGLYPAAAGFLNLFTIDREPLTVPRIAATVLPSMIALMTAAAMLGSQLFPPLAPKHLRNRSLARQC